MNKRTILILLSILSVAAFLRFYKLTLIPPSLEWDEVSTGYDANSILKTGRDQYGHFLPLTFRSLDDYKPPLYTYLTVGSIAIFGWNDFAVRFPAAFLGVLAVLTTFGMTQALFKNKKLSLLTALFLAISPWHVNFSRLALETNSTIFFTTAGMWAFIKGLRSGKYLPLASIFFGLDLFLYHNARVFIPFISVILILLYWKDLWTQKKYVFISAFIAFVFVIALLPIITSTAGLMRFQGTSIFTSAVSLETAELKQTYQHWRQVDTEHNEGLIGSIFHNSKTLFTLLILKNYLTHFDPNFWVFTNDSFRHHAGAVGLLYIVDLPLIYIGTTYMLQQKNKQAGLLILAWALIAPIPASLTRDVPHALRSEIFLPTLQIAIAFAFCWIQTYFARKNLRRKVIIAFLLVGYFLNSSFFIHQYYVHFNEDTSEYWVYGRREAALFAESIKDKYDRILVSTKLEQPQAFFLYYLKYDPVKYLAQGGTFSGGWAEDRNKFDKYQFRPIDFSKMQDGKTLFIGQPEEFPSGITTLKKIYYLNGKEAIWIVAG